MKTPDPKKLVEKKVQKFKKDTFGIIWLVFIAALVVMTYFFKQYLQDIIVISLLFIIFWYFEPLVFGVTGKTVTTFLSRGQKVPTWKRFPLFFLIILLLYGVYGGLQTILKLAFPAGAINLVFVALWIGFLFLLWTYRLSKE